MSQSKVTLIVNGSTYRLDVHDRASLQAVSGPDRRILVELLRSLENAKTLPKETPFKPKEAAPISPSQSSTAYTGVINSASTTSMAYGGDSGKDDADNMAASLLIAESHTRKTKRISKTMAYIWIFGIMGVIGLLVSLLISK